MSEHTTLTACRNWLAAQADSYKNKAEYCVEKLGKEALEIEANTISRWVASLDKLMSCAEKK